MRRQRQTIFILILTILLLAFFFRNANLRQVWVEVRHAELTLLLAATIMQAATYLVRALRWQYLLRPIGRVRLSTAFRTTVVGFAASFLLPARAGEFLRPYLLARREGLSATATFATVVLERLLDASVVLLLFGSFLLFFDPGMTAIDSRVFGAVKVGGALSAAGAVVALCIIFLLAGHPEKLGRAALQIDRVLPVWVAHSASSVVQRFTEGLAVMRQPMQLLVAVTLSFPLWLSIAVGIWLVTRSFHIELPYTGSFLLMVLLVVGVSVPTPGAIGGFHAAYQIGVTAFYAVPNDQAVGAALVLHAVSFLPVTLLGVVYMAQDGLNLSRIRRLASPGGEGEVPNREAVGEGEQTGTRANGYGASVSALSSAHAEDEGEPG